MPTSAQAGTRSVHKNKDWGACHVGAVSQTWTRACGVAYRSGVAGVARQGVDESLAEIIERLDETTAKMLLERAATESASIAAAVRLAVAGPEDRVGILRAEPDDMLRTRRHLDYREANEWALEAAAVVDAIEAEAEGNPSRELLKLIELSVGRVVKVILKSDDSSGMMGDVAHRLLADPRAGGSHGDCGAESAGSVDDQVRIR